jgi:hypothetical protein
MHNFYFYALCDANEHTKLSFQTNEKQKFQPDFTNQLFTDNEAIVGWTHLTPLTLEATYMYYSQIQVAYVAAF